MGEINYINGCLLALVHNRDSRTMLRPVLTHRRQHRWFLGNTQPPEVAIPGARKRWVERLRCSRTGKQQQEDR